MTHIKLMVKLMFELIMLYSFYIDSVLYAIVRLIGDLFVAQKPAQAVYWR